MLVYVALALAVAFVLRRGDGPGVLAGIVLGVHADLGVRARDATLPRPLRHVRRSRSIAYRLAEPLGYWNALGLLARLGRSRRRSASLRTHGARSLALRAAAAVVPIIVTTLYFTFSRGAWAALVVGFVVALAMDPRRLRLLWVTFVVALPCARVHRVRVSPRCADDRGRAAGGGGTREGHRVAAVVCVAARQRRQLARMGSARRSPGACRCLAYALGGRSTSRLPVLSWRAVARSVRGRWPSRERLDGLEERFNADPTVGDGRPQRATLQRLRQRAGASASRRLGCGPRASADRQRLGHLRVPLVPAATRPASSCAMRTRCTWRRSPSSASSGSPLLVARCSSRSWPESARDVSGSSLRASARSSRGPRPRPSTGTGRWSGSR